MARKAGGDARAALRRRAEEALARQAPATPAGEADTQRLLHELQVHQIELEMQNEALHLAQVAAEAANRRLNGRINALQVFYELSERVAHGTLSLDGLCQEVAASLPASWQHPEIACARIRLDGKEFHSREFVEPRWKQSTPIRVRGVAAGVVEVGYREARPACDEGPFLVEERQFLEAIAERLGRISERMAAEADLSAARHAAELANQAKTRFLASASHDLRQPIQAIGLYNDALANTLLDEKQRLMCRQLAKSVHSLSWLLNQLLDISKLDAGMLDPRPEIIRAEDLLATIATEFESATVEKGQRLDLFCPGEGLLLYSDRSILLAMLRNLVGNAVKYTAQGRILISIRPRKGRALIQVWDTGIGIAAEHLDHIFEEYFQVGNPERDRSKGVGLGLAIVKRLSSLLDAGISCRSRAGKGSVFQLSVALANPAQARAFVQQAGEADEAGDATRFAGKRMVVVEDDAMAADALRLSLELLGMQVVLYSSAEAALAGTGETAADYYVSDYRLPGMDGLQFLTAMQARSATPIRGILLTGDTAPDRIVRARASGWPVLLKPVELARLLSALEPAAAVQ